MKELRLVNLWGEVRCMPVKICSAQRLRRFASQIKGAFLPALKRLSIQAKEGLSGILLEMKTKVEVTGLLERIRSGLLGAFLNLSAQARRLRYPSELSLPGFSGKPVPLTSE